MTRNTRVDRIFARAKTITREELRGATLELLDGIPWNPEPHPYGVRSRRRRKDCVARGRA